MGLPVLQPDRVPLGVEELQCALDYDESNHVFPGLREEGVYYQVGLLEEEHSS